MFSCWSTWTIGWSSPHQRLSAKLIQPQYYKCVLSFSIPVHHLARHEVVCLVCNMVSVARQLLLHGQEDSEYPLCQNNLLPGVIVSSRVPESCIWSRSSRLPPSLFSFVGGKSGHSPGAQGCAVPGSLTTSLYHLMQGWLCPRRMSASVPWVPLSSEVSMKSDVSDH